MLFHFKVCLMYYASACVYNIFVTVYKTEDPNAHQDNEVGVLRNFIRQSLTNNYEVFNRKSLHSRGKNYMKITLRKLETWGNQNNKA